MLTINAPGHSWRQQVLPRTQSWEKFHPLCCASPELGVSVARRSQRSLRAESWSRSRSRSWSQSREDTDKAERLGSAAAVASEVAAMMASEAADPTDTYQAGARLGRTRTEGGVGSKSRPQPERSWAGCGSLRAPAASSAAAPRRPPASKEGARRRLHPPSPAPCTPPSLCFPLGYLSAPAVRRWGWRPLRVMHQLQAPGLRSPDLSREEAARSLLMRFLHLEPPSSLR